MSNELTIWSNEDQLTEIKNIFAKDLLDTEFKTFV